jgi:hypothetical protein
MPMGKWSTLPYLGSVGCPFSIHWFWLRTTLFTWWRHWAQCVCDRSTEDAYNSLVPGCTPGTLLINFHLRLLNFFGLFCNKHFALRLTLVLFAFWIYVILRLKLCSIRIKVGLSLYSVRFYSKQNRINIKTIYHMSLNKDVHWRIHGSLLHISMRTKLMLPWSTKNVACKFTIHVGISDLFSGHVFFSESEP